MDLWISLPYATFRIRVEVGTCTYAAPIARWMIGKSRDEIEAWVRSKDGVVEVLGRPPQRNLLFTDAETTTVLAALRYWQRNLGDGPPIADHFAEVEPLTVEEIDDLCERINTDDGDDLREQLIFARAYITDLKATVMVLVSHGGPPPKFCPACSGRPNPSVRRTEASTTPTVPPVEGDTVEMWPDPPPGHARCACGVIYRGFDGDACEFCATEAVEGRFCWLQRRFGAAARLRDPLWPTPQAVNGSVYPADTDLPDPVGDDYLTVSTAGSYLETDGTVVWSTPMDAKSGQVRPAHRPRTLRFRRHQAIDLVGFH